MELLLKTSVEIEAIDDLSAKADSH